MQLLNGFVIMYAVTGQTSHTCVYIFTRNLALDYAIMDSYFLNVLHIIMVTDYEVRLEPACLL